MSFLRVLCLSGLALVASCGSSETKTDDGLLFQGEGKLLEGFSFNTGAQPPTGPASLTLRLSGSGAVKVEARGAIADGKIAGKAGNGKVDIDAHVKLDGTLKVDSPVKKSTGDIPGLKDIDIAITGSAAFDPFLLEGGSADVTANIPETKLPDIPLGSVPGKLRLTIKAGSILSSKFQASCMTVTAGSALYEGSAVTAGSLLIKGTIVLELPAPLNKEVELPEMTVPIPSATSKVEFKAVATSGVSDGQTGACSTGTDAGADGTEEDTSTTGDSTVTDSTVDDSGFDTGFSETGVSDSSPSDTPVDTGPKSCSGEAHEPDGTESSARSLGLINDCDGSGKTVSGVLTGGSDTDVLRFDGDDSFGCSVNAYAKATGAVNFCLKPVCNGGTTNLQGCPKGTKTGSACCGTSEVEADFNCSGTVNESAKVYLTVRPASSFATCTSYSIAYHF